MSTFDPKKNYVWSQDTEFVLTGAEFGLILNTFRTVLAEEEAQRILRMNNASKAMENLLERSVNEGKAFEAPGPGSPPIAPMQKVEDKKE